jgi:hypothetical protein
MPSVACPDPRYWAELLLGGLAGNSGKRFRIWSAIST